MDAIRPGCAGPAGTGTAPPGWHRAPSPRPLPGERPDPAPRSLPSGSRATNTRGISVGEKKKAALGFHPSVRSLETPQRQGLSGAGTLK